MKKEVLALSIGEVTRLLSVSIDTLRRWDKKEKLVSFRNEKGVRCYHREDIEDFLSGRDANVMRLISRNWAKIDKANEPPSVFYCKDISVFNARLSRFSSELKGIMQHEDKHALIPAITGEIGNNAFDHNFGNWPDVPGLFFGYDLDKRFVVLADRGQGILTTLKRVKPGLRNHIDALKVAFTEIISGRSPENRGNGLKYVKKIVTNYKFTLKFQSGDAVLDLPQEGDFLGVETTNKIVQGCLAFINF